MEKVMKGLRWKERYFRLNVKYENKKKIELDEFDRIGEMIEDSEEYMMKNGPKGAKEKIGVILVDPESERNRKLDEEWGLHGLILPELQPTMTSSTSSSSEDDKKADPGSSGAGSSDTTAKYNQAGTSNSENRLRENKGDDGKFDLTWAQSSTKLSDIQAVIFYHYDDFGNGWDLAKQPRHGDSVLFDRRDQGESAVAVKVRSKASFVSTNFIKKFKIKPQEVLAVSRNAVRNFLGTQQGVQPDVYINLTFRCRGFNMPKQRATFYILKSDGFDIMFGEDIMMRNSLANQAGIGSQENRDGKQTVVGNLIAKARPLIGRRESQNARGKGKGKETDNDDRDTYASDFRNGPLL
ncbi:hypothetical protein DL98DRAFT_521002 [Cadophora sp. DSE1049]|nr:hypothetical protein DL98DRAFT_521002 [Cadophora sp. DSE1049]